MSVSTETVVSRRTPSREVLIWKVSQILDKVKRHILTKPRVGRDAKDWDYHPIIVRGKENVSIKKYIMFIMEHSSDVEAVIVNKRDDELEYVVDGNHRIFAKVIFHTHPLEIFNTYKEVLFDFIEKTYDANVHDELKKIFEQMNYTELVDLSYRRFFMKVHDIDWYNKYMKVNHQDWEDFWDGFPDDNVPSFRDLFLTTCDRKLKFTDIETPISYSTGLTQEQEVSLFTDVNKFKSPLTDTAKAVGTFNHVTDFTIDRMDVRSAISDACVKLYKNRSIGEVLNCYQYDMSNGIINASDFILSYQNWCNDRCKFIEESTYTGSGLSFFFKVWKCFFNQTTDDYGHTFSTTNVNIFIDYIEYVISIFDKIDAEFSPTSIPDRLKSSKIKTYSLTANNTLALIMTICGFRCNNTPDNDVVKTVSRAILYHFFVYSINPRKDISISNIKVDVKQKKKGFKLYNALSMPVDSERLVKLGYALYTNPTNLTLDITEDRMREVLSILIIQNLKERPYETRENDNTKRKMDTRRVRTCFELLLMVNVYRQKVPLALLNDIFEVEHLFCFGSDWDTEINLDIDRLGNTFPILKMINRLRRNLHIKQYKEIEKENNIEFIKYVHEFIPSDEIYDQVATHDTKSHIINPTEYNKQCEANERLYIDELIKRYF